MSEKLTDAGGRGMNEGEAEVWELTVWLLARGGRAPLAVIGVLQG